MKIALGQISATDNPAENLTKVAHFSTQAAQAGAQLIIFPEATHSRFGSDLSAIAEQTDGPWARHIATIAQEQGLTIVAGMFTPAPSNKLYNTLLVADASGKIDTYRKIHLFDAFDYRESDTIAAGSEPLVLPIANTLIGFSTCYDIRFPSLYSQLASRGAEVLVIAASWGDGPGKIDQWNILTRARALDTASFVLACDQAPPSEPVTTLAPLGIGHSAVISPYGVVLDQLSRQEGLLIHEIDPHISSEARKKFGFIHANPC